MCIIGTASATKDLEFGIRVDVVATPDPVAPGGILEYYIDYSVFSLSQIGADGKQTIGISYDPADLEFISASRSALSESPGVVAFDLGFGSGSMSIYMKVLRATPGIIATEFHSLALTGPPEFSYIGESRSTITTDVTIPSAVPEFPSMAIPVVIIIGMAFLILFIRK
ncbi:MAG: hypothetical protein APR53_10920 [Methanoculleus sp. SDB]|nr:MAG: hypothetical protein APR53_10920 [Methanoculleus sp. SDB]